MPRPKPQTDNPKPRNRRTKPKEEDVGRQVLYPEYRAVVCEKEAAITAEKCKDLLGWTEETEEVKFGADYLLIDRYGKKIRCFNNPSNRPLYLSVVETLIQEHLRKRWRLNGEALIIGRTGLVLNGQHTLISTVLAEQIREMDLLEDKPLYADVWPGPITMEKVIVFGIQEDDETANTMDTCKPRSLADVIYRSKYFSALNPSDRKTAARVMGYAVPFLWNRTWAMENPFSPDLRRTHSESLGFLERHPKVLQAVKHIMEESKGGGFDKFHMSPGVLAGLLYLMGCCASSPEEYEETRKEDSLDWSLWEKACEYFVYLGAGGTDLQEVRYAFGALHGVDGEGGGGTTEEKVSILIKGWQSYKDGRQPTAEDLKLKYSPVKPNGMRDLVELVTSGGIDKGEVSWRSRVADEAEVESEEGDDPSEEEILSLAEEIREGAKPSTNGSHADSDEEPVKPVRRRPVPRKQPS